MNISILIFHQYFVMLIKLKDYNNKNKDQTDFVTIHFIFVNIRLDVWEKCC